MNRIIDLNSDVRFPLYGLPPLVQAVIREVAQARQAPTDYVTAPVLVAMGVAVGSKALVKEDYTNRLNLFVGAVGESSMNKSQPSKDVFEPLSRINKELYSEYKKICEQIETASILDRERKKGKNSPQKPKMPKPKQLIMTDATPEARAEVIECNPHGVLWWRDELAALFLDFERYNKSGEATDLISIYDGHNIQINRKGDGLKCLSDPWLSIFGTIQPSALSAAFSKTIFLDNGLVPRFLWFIPYNTIDRDFSKSKEPDKDVMRAWSGFIKSLYDHDLSEPIFFANEVREILDAFRNKTGNGKRGYEATIWNKLHIVVYKLSGIAAVANWCANGFVGSPVVTEEGMCWSIDCAYYFHRTALEVEKICRNGSHTIVAKNPTKAEALKMLLRESGKPIEDFNQTQLAMDFGLSRQTINKICGELKQE